MLSMYVCVENGRVKNDSIRVEVAEVVEVIGMEILFDVSLRSYRLLPQAGVKHTVS